MKLSNIFLAFFVLFGLVRFAAAEEPDKEREKVKSDLFMPECSWSKMDKQEYDQCQKKRSTMKVMTPEERERYLKATEGESAVVNDSGGLIRNKAIINRGGG